MLPSLEGQLFIRSRTVVSRVVGGETLIVPVRGKVGDLASIYSFNGTGTLIWQLLDSPRDLAELIDAVEREYAVQPEQAHRDVTRFLEDMHSVGLVEACERQEQEQEGEGQDFSRATSEPQLVRL